MQLIINDGGRSLAGFRGATGDCVCRAVSIAAELPYIWVYNKINEIAKSERAGKNKGARSSARTGVHKYTYKRLFSEIGWVWTPTMFVGGGCRVHLTPSELPHGRLVVRISKHFTAVIDGVIHDVTDCSRSGSRCVYGYWSKGVSDGT